jgi:Flp pilus assembly protein TadD
VFGLLRFMRALFVKALQRPILFELKWQRVLQFDQEVGEVQFHTIFTAFAAALFLAAVVTAQLITTPGSDTGLGGSNSITGSVLVAGARLERRVTIRLRTMTRGDRVATTDEYGNFSFRGLISGDYTIVIDKEPDFEPYSQNISVLQVRGFPAQAYNVSVRLTPKSVTTPKPGVLDVALASLPEKGKAIFVKAREYGSAGDHVAAIEQLSTLTNEFPNFMPGFNELGLEYLKTNDLVRADQSFQQAIKLQSDAFAPQMNRGIVLVSMKRFAEAANVLQNAKKIDEHSGTVAYFLGQALANLGKFDEAEKELTRAVALGGDEMKEAHRILAIIYSSRGDKKRAVIELETYLKIGPPPADADDLKRALEKLKAEQRSVD